MISFVSLFKLIVNFIYTLAPIGQSDRMFVNGPGSWSLIPGRVIPKTQKIVLDIFLFNTQNYKERTKGKVEQSNEMSNALP